MGGERRAELRRVVRAHGFYRRAPARVLVELALHLAVTVVGIVAFVATDTVLTRVLAVVVAAVGSVGVGTNSHTSSHYATSDRRWVNEALTYFGLPLFLQLSATYWWHKHLALHHRAPNVVGVDRDADFHPLFALTESEVRAASPRWQAYYRRQWLVLPLALAFNGFTMQVYGWRHVLGALAAKRWHGTAYWIDLSLLLTHWTLWVLLPAMILPLGDVLAFALGRSVGAGVLFFFILAPAHLPAIAVCLASPDTRGDTLLLQTSATVNFRTGFAGRLLCSGLEYQIEHHLFPNVSHVHYPRMSPMIREFCLRHGYPHRTLGWGEGVRSAFEVFRHPKPVLPRPPGPSAEAMTHEGGQHA